MAPRIRSVLVTMSAAGLLTVAAPGTASACSCQLVTIADQLTSADISVAFSGAAVRSTEPSGPDFSSADLVTWTFDVDAVHKGAVASVTEVRTAVSGASCGVDFIVDRRYLVLARVDADGQATASLCDGTTPVDQLSAADLVLLEPGTAPVETVAAPPVSAVPEGSVWSSPASWVAVAVLGAALTSVVVVAVRRRPGS